MVVQRGVQLSGWVNLCVCETMSEAVSFIQVAKPLFLFLRLYQFHFFIPHFATLVLRWAAICFYFGTAN